jgi:hypothetical protein
MRITSKTVHDINKMEDNFALRYVFTYPGIIIRADNNLNILRYDVLFILRLINMFYS